MEPEAGVIYDHSTRSDILLLRTREPIITDARGKQHYPVHQLELRGPRWIANSFPLTSFGPRHEGVVVVPPEWAIEEKYTCAECGDTIWAVADYLCGGCRG